MTLMDALTWVFRSAFLLGVVIGVPATIRYQHRTHGTWRRRPAGVMLMLLIAGLTLTMVAVGVRVLMRAGRELLGIAIPEWVDLAVLSFSAAGVYAVVFGMAFCWWLVEYRQPDYSPDKAPPDNGKVVPMMSNGGSGRPRWRSWPFWKDFGERVGWTAAQAAVALVSVEALDLPGWSIPLAAAGLAALKAFVARQIGDEGTASTVRLLWTEPPADRREHF